MAVSLMLVMNRAVLLQVNDNMVSLILKFDDVLCLLFQSLKNPRLRQNQYKVFYKI